MPRGRVYLTLSVQDADLLVDHLDAILGAGYEDANGRLEKIKDRLITLTEAQRPNLAEGMFDGPPADYAG
jgi:hypothetical protein